MTVENMLPTINHLEMRGIIKRFPGVLAVNQVNFDVHAGEVHALLGENGAGKSTLMKILYGLYKPDAGEIRLNDKPAVIRSPSDAIMHGIGMVHQHFMLVQSLTVAENIALGLRSSREPLLNLDEVAERIEQLAKKYGLQVDPSRPVWQLSVGEQQRVEIIKALYRGAALLILDEPTAVLTPQEVDDLFNTLQQMVRDGHALIFISHKLHEVLSISNRVTVLRDGRLVGSVPTKEATKQNLARMMVGRDVVMHYEREQTQTGDPLLRVENLWAKSDRGTDALCGVTLDVRAGEILGIAGVSGNGQRELAQVIFGLRAASQGEVCVGEENVTGKAPDSLNRLGVSYIPEERMADGVIRDFTVAENLILEDHGTKAYSWMIFLNPRAISRRCGEMIQTFNIRTPRQDTPIKSLSGGNIQKLILARELARNPRVLIAAQPTRGVDIGATEYIHQQLLNQRQRGTATLLISEDLDEIMSLADRIAVIYEGKIMGVVDRRDAQIEQLGLMMAGVQAEP
ncbi:MAG TPA: ABC transporter ATP-binding protein [Aggregatilineaceae bacterium]|nr:ABC transporter ATP-binding protein [Aggregatilineaceae bacterium]